MSIEKLAFKGATWLAFFKFISQVFSWTTTILVARMLVPSDYGLMELAAIIVGYAMMFSDLGLGEAIIQRKSSNKNELSSVFWLALGFGIFLAILSFILSYVTAWTFNEPRVVPLTKALGLVFILQGATNVPLNLLRKNLQFKFIGFIEFTSIIVSCICMLIIAHLGGGVWTLLGGSIVLSISKLILVFIKIDWVPSFHFSFKEAKAYLTFGIQIVLQGTFFYIYEKSDKFFAGRVWSPKTLGLYSFALQLAQIPTEKITVLINQVSFSALSLLQEDKKRFNEFYLSVIKITATIVIPLFVGGYIIGEDLIKLLLDDKWLPITKIFRFLCLAQILTSMVAVNNFVHNAQGRPHWSVIFNVACAILMSISYFLVVPYGLEAIIIPWFSTYVILSISWIVITVKKIDLSILVYLKKIFHPFLATAGIFVGINLFKYLNNILGIGISNTLYLVLIQILLAGFIYIGYFWFFERNIFYYLKKFIKP
jgi:O-antigen/teichoic acid export membrane protein